MDAKKTIENLLVGRLPIAKERIKNYDWYAKHRGRLRKEYGKQFILIKEQEVIDSSKDPDDLVEIKKSTMNETAIIEYVPEKEAIVYW